MKNKNKKFALPAIILVSVFLGGCAPSDFNDLNSWMSEQSKNVKGKIDPLPQAKTFTPRNFVAKQNPFEGKEPLLLTEMDNNKYAPDLNRRKEPLESYTLETLKMTGFLNSKDGPQAIIKSIDAKTHFVKLNNYMGKNFGKVTKINEGQMILEERVVDNTGIWTLREAIVYLEDGSKTR